MSFIGSFFGGMAARAAVPMVALGGAGAYKSGALDNLPIGQMLGTAPSHYEMDARIVSVSTDCRLLGRVNGSLRRTQAMRCSEAVSLLKTPAFVGYEVTPSEYVEYIYYAPDGQNTLRGSISRSRDAQGRAYRKGGVVKIRVDAKDPQRSEVI